MAKTGVLHAVAVPIESEEYGKLPTYGTGFIIGHAISVSPSPNYGENPLYGDNEEIDNDTDLIDGGISINVDEFGTSNKEAFEIEQKLLGGAITTSENGGVTEKHTGTAVTNTYFGYGHVEPGRYAKGKGAYFEARFWYRCKFKPTGSTINTRTGTTTWQTPTIEGKFYPVAGVETDRNVEKKARFDKESDAVAWLDALAHIESATATTTTTTTGDDGI